MSGNKSFLLSADTIIFDLDGTLLESMGVWNEIDCILIHKLGGPWEEEMMVGKRRDALLAEYSGKDNPYGEYCGALGRMYGSSLAKEEILDLRHTIDKDFLRNQVDYKPGAPELIKKLHSLGKTLVIATTTKRPNILIYRTENRHIMDKAAFDDYFTAIYTREDVKAIKPSPEVHERILHDLHKKREDCFILEDSLSSIRAARAAGIPVGAVYDRYSEEDGETIRKLSDCWYDSLAVACRELEKY